MPSNNIAFARSYTSVIDEVSQRASVSGALNSGGRMVLAGHNVKEILIPKISVTDIGDYTRNVGCKTSAITYEFKTKTFLQALHRSTLPESCPANEHFVTDQEGVEAARAALARP